MTIFGVLITIMVAILTIVGIAPLFFIINNFVDDIEELYKDNDNDVR